MDSASGQIKAAYACAQQTAAGVAIVLTAAATEDGVKITGESIDRLGYDSAALVVTAKASLANTKTLSFAAEYQDSADNSTWNTAVALYASTVLLTGSGSGTNEEGTKETALDLRGLARYIRFNVTPDLSATGTDTAVWAAVCILGGADRLPAA